MATVDKKLLKRLKLLYVEDDESVRSELSTLLSNFFDTIYTAEDGKEGLSLYKEKEDEIDVIIADINMPNLTGIEMVQEIRKFDKEVPVIFATAYSDNEFLSEAIKLKVFEYIIKPIDIRKLMTVLGELAKIIYQDFLLNQQNKELKKYKDIMYNNNIVIRTNKNMKISFVNDLFCQITGFDKDELIGQELISLKYEEVDSDIYKKIYSNIYENKQWNGELKNNTKDGNYYIADTSIISTLNDAGEITGALLIQKDETKKAIKRRNVQTSLIKDKSEIFKRSKETTVELESKINELNEQIAFLNSLIENERDEKNRYINTSERYSKENKSLRRELNDYKKDTAISQKSKNKVRVSKENEDLRLEIKKLRTKLDNIKEEHSKELKQQKVNYEIKLDDMEKDLIATNNKIDNIEDVEAITQKINYWKDKAKSESKRAEVLERSIINLGDKDIMTKLLGRN